MNMSFTYIFISKTSKNELNTVIISNDKIVINNVDYPIQDIEYVEGEIVEHSRIEKISGDKVSTEFLPSGVIRIKIRNKDSFEFSIINPLNTVEEFVLKLNNVFDKINADKFYLKESSVYKVTYSRI